MFNFFHKNYGGSKCHLFILCLLVSCSFEYDNFTDNKPIDYSIVSKLELNIPDTVNYSFEYWSVKKINDKYLLIGLIENKIELFDLSNNKYLKRIDLEWDGPNDVGIVTQFYLHNLDSVFLFSKSHRAIYLINQDGIKLDKYDVNKSLESFNQALSIECFRNYGDRLRFLPESNSLLLRTYPPYDLVKDIKTYQVPYKILYNIKTRKVDNFFGLFPEEISQGETYYSNDYQVSYCENCPKDVFSFRRSHHLYEIDINQNKLLKLHKAKSNYINLNFNLISRNADFDKVRNHFLNQPSYVNILYNPKQEQYFRLVNHKKLENGTKGTSIIILDKSLEVVGEIILPNNTYFIKSAQVVDNGILIYRYNGDESKLTYDIISTKN